MNYTADELRKLADALDALGTVTSDGGVTVGVHTRATVGLGGVDAFEIAWDDQAMIYTIDLGSAYR